MGLLFHQNMLNFGGGTPVRNAAFATGFGAINAETGADYVAAGFTEITNWDTAYDALAALATTLDGGLTHLTIIRVGYTALNGTEFIGIAWDPHAITVACGGQVLRDSVTRAWTAHVQAGDGAGALPAKIDTPKGMGFLADTRGPAFIAGIRAGTGEARIYVFYHNMYQLGDGSGGFQSLPTVVDRIRSALGGPFSNAKTFIGGDFNVDPHPPATASFLGVYPLKLAAATDDDGDYINTTNVHAYDFWLSTDNAYDDDDASVYTDTRDDDQSDHAAIVLAL
jgi:hypothetical protein